MQENHVPVDSPDRDTAELMTVTVSFPVWEGISIRTLGGYIRGAGISFLNNESTTGLTGGDTIGAVVVPREEQGSPGFPILIDARVMTEGDAARFERLIDLDEERIKNV